MTPSQVLDAIDGEPPSFEEERSRYLLPERGPWASIDVSRGWGGRL